MPHLSTYFYSSPIPFNYLLKLSFDDASLVKLDWQAKPFKLPKLALQKNRINELPLKTLDAYFSKDFKTYAKLLPKLPLNPHGTPFQQSVWKVMQSIPLGKTLSYQEVAAKIHNPQAARAVGGACGKNPIPILIPCHRILAANKKIGGFSGGLARKRELLHLEGVFV